MRCWLLVTPRRHDEMQSPQSFNAIRHAMRGLCDIQYRYTQNASCERDNRSFQLQKGLVATESSCTNIGMSSTNFDLNLGAASHIGSCRSHTSVIRHVDEQWRGHLLESAENTARFLANCVRKVIAAGTEEGLTGIGRSRSAPRLRERVSGIDLA